MDDQNDHRIRQAAELPMEQIEAALPDDLLLGLKTIATNMCVPWMGILVGLVTPLQHAMGHAYVEMEDSDFLEPCISWTIIHMSSGSRKSKIYKFIDKIIREVFEANDLVDINQATFEKIGLLMKEKNNTALWYFDEGRSFFSQLQMYNKGSERNEAALLSMYDGSKWVHQTAQSVSFVMKYTKLTIGGFTQTEHMLSLMSNKDRTQSGFIPRFLPFLLKPVSIDIKLTRAVPTSIYDQLVNVIYLVKIFHEDAVQPVRKHLLGRDTAAFELFCNYSNTVNKWVVDNFYVTRLNYARGMVSKSVGQVLRMSSILNCLLIFSNSVDAQQFEHNSTGTVKPNFLELLSTHTKELPISAMAMEAAIQLVTYSIRQNFILNGMEFIDIICSNGNVDVQLTQTPQQINQTPTSSSKKRTVIQILSAEGKVLTLPGSKMNIRRINSEKKLGRNQGERLSKVLQVFCNLMAMGFGTLSNDIFEFHEDIVEKVQQDKTMLDFLTSCKVSLSRFIRARNSPSLYASVEHRGTKAKANGEVPAKNKSKTTTQSSTSTTPQESPLRSSCSSQNTLHHSPVVKITFMGNPNATLSPNTLTAFISTDETSTLGSQLFNDTNAQAYSDDDFK